MRGRVKDANAEFGLFSTSMERYHHITEDALETTEDMDEHMAQLGKTADSTWPKLENVNQSIKRSAEMFAGLNEKFQGYMTLVDRLKAAHEKAEQEKADRIRQEQKDKEQAEQDARDAAKAAQEEQDRKNREGTSVFDSGIGRPFKDAAGNWVYPSAGGGSRGLGMSAVIPNVGDLSGIDISDMHGMSSVFQGELFGKSFMTAMQNARFAIQNTEAMRAMEGSTSDSTMAISRVVDGQMITAKIAIDLNVNAAGLADDETFKATVIKAFNDAAERGSIDYDATTMGRIN